MMGHRYGGLLGTAIGMVALVCGPAPPGAVATDIFFLRQGGQVHGRWLNPGTAPPAEYVIRAVGGGEIRLARKVVDRVVRRSAAEDEYARRAHACPDTVDGHWKLAQWCADQRLAKQRRRQLQRIVQLDPANEAARRALGYRQVDGKWMTRDEQMAARGLRLYHGQYRTAQEIELREQARKRRLTEREWYKKLKRWRSWLRSGKARRIDTAQREILAIRDSTAVPALIESLQREAVPEIDFLLIDALARVAAMTGAGSDEEQATRIHAIKALVRHALFNANQEVRIACLDHLVDMHRTEVTGLFIKSLKSKDRGEVNRTAAALKALGDPAAIPPLIDALVTVHKVRVGSGNPGQTTASFSPGGGGGVGFGTSGPRVVKVAAANPEVLSALVALTGENFEYREKDWVAWYASRHRSEPIDARRD